MINNPLKIPNTSQKKQKAKGKFPLASFYPAFLKVK